MTQALLFADSGGYSLGPGAGIYSTVVMTVPQTTPAIGRASIFFNWVSSTSGSGNLKYYVSFAPTFGATITVFGSSVGELPTALDRAYAMHGVAIEDTSNAGDTVAGGGVLTLSAYLSEPIGSITTPSSDDGAWAAVVLQADSPSGYKMRPVGLGTFPFESGRVQASATIKGVNKSTGPFITVLAFAAVGGGLNPVFTPSDPQILLSPLNSSQANNATIEHYFYVSPTDWNWTPAQWFILPPFQPSFTIPTTWTGPTNIYGGTPITMAHEPISLGSGVVTQSTMFSGFRVIHGVPPPIISTGARSRGQVVG